MLKEWRGDRAVKHVDYQSGDTGSIPCASISQSTFFTGTTQQIHLRRDLQVWKVSEPISTLKSIKHFIFCECHAYKSKAEIDGGSAINSNSGGGLSGMMSSGINFTCLSAWSGKTRPVDAENEKRSVIID